MLLLYNQTLNITYILPGRFIVNSYFWCTLACWFTVLSAYVVLLHSEFWHVANSIIHTEVCTGNV